MNELQIFNHQDFGQIRTIEKNNVIWFVGKDVAEALGYADARKALSKHIDEDDRAFHPVTDNLGREQATTIVNESGVYALVFGSKLPKAKEFKRWVTAEVLPTIRKTGSYTVVRQESVVEKGEFLLKCAENAKTDNWKQLLVRGAANMVAGYELLPPLEVPKTYSAGEVGKMLGISANMVGRIAKRNGFKTSEYGVWCHDIARNGQKEVEIFRYNENGIEAIGEAIHNL